VAQILGFEKLGLGLDNCGRTTINAYCPIYSLWPKKIKHEEKMSRKMNKMITVIGLQLPNKIELIQPYRINAILAHNGTEEPS
jgi:hypothetical protein